LIVGIPKLWGHPLKPIKSEKTHLATLMEKGRGGPTYGRNIRTIEAEKKKVA